MHFNNKVLLPIFKLPWGWRLPNRRRSWRPWRRKGVPTCWKEFCQWPWGKTPRGGPRPPDFWSTLTGNRLMLGRSKEDRRSTSQEQSTLEKMEKDLERLLQISLLTLNFQFIYMNPNARNARKPTVKFHFSTMTTRHSAMFGTAVFYYRIRKDRHRQQRLYVFCARNTLCQFQ